MNSNARCPKCDLLTYVSARSGQRIGDHVCPDCGTPLVSANKGSGSGRYLCPITLDQVVIRVSGIQLDQPMTLHWRPGPVPGARPDYVQHNPDPMSAIMLDRIAGQVLGKGCVISDRFDPARPADPHAGLVLALATEPGEPSTWLVNERLMYRRCVACKARLADSPVQHVPFEWTPRRTSAVRGFGSNRRTIRIDPGPYPAGTLACGNCDPRM